MNPMSASPRLSIVIATWNAARTFERCIRSITGQTFTHWELLIADGGSTDGTIELIRAHQSQIAWWQTHKDAGIYDAWNQALAHVKGEYVCFLGADDALVSPETLATLFQSIGDEHYDLVTSRGRMMNPSGGHGMLMGSAWDFKRLGRRMVICHPGLLHSRMLFERFGLFDTRYRIAGDLEFLLRLPEDITTHHVDAVTVAIDTTGVSRTNVLRRLREQRTVLSRCARYGPVRAYIAWADKLWRYPIASVFGIPH